MPHRTMPVFLAGMVAFCAGLGQGALAQENSPVRVVSTTLCTDQLAMLVADDAQLVCVSHLAADPHMSAVVEQSAAYHMSRCGAEQIYLMQTDLVLADAFSGGASVSMLRRLGVNVVTFQGANTLAGVRKSLREMGVALGRDACAAELVAQFDAQFLTYRDEGQARPRAALYHANGYTSGDRSLAGEILAAAGLANIAVETGFAAGGILSLEVLAVAQPETVITSARYAAGSRTEEAMGHPVVEALRAGHSTASSTSSDWVCGTPVVLRAIADMTALRIGLEGSKP